MKEKDMLKTKQNSKLNPQDEKLEEWLEKVDLSDAIESAFEKRNVVPLKVGRKKIGKRVSLILPEESIVQLTQLSKEKGMGYQTLARMFILEKIEETSKKKAG